MTDAREYGRERIMTTKNPYPIPSWTDAKNLAGDTQPARGGETITVHWELGKDDAPEPPPGEPATPLPAPKPQ